MACKVTEHSQGCSDYIVLTNSVIQAGIHYLIYMYSFTVTQDELVASKLAGEVYIRTGLHD